MEFIKDCLGETPNYAKSCFWVIIDSADQGQILLPKFYMVACNETISNLKLTKDPKQLLFPSYVIRKNFKVLVQFSLILLRRYQKLPSLLLSIRHCDQLRLSFKDVEKFSHFKMNNFTQKVMLSNTSIDCLDGTFTGLIWF